MPDSGCERPVLPLERRRLRGFLVGDAYSGDRKDHGAAYVLIERAAGLGQRRDRRRGRSRRKRRLSDVSAVQSVSLSELPQRFRKPSCSACCNRANCADDDAGLRIYLPEMLASLRGSRAGRDVSKVPVLRGDGPRADPFRRVCRPGKRTAEFTAHGALRDLQRPARSRCLPDETRNVSRLTLQRRSPGPVALVLGFPAVGPLEETLDPNDQLFAVERFDEVVVGP